MKRLSLFLLALAVLFAATGATAYAKPNFSGEWKLDADKSNFGPMPPPDRFNLSVKHSDPDLEITTDQAGPQGEDKSTAKYKTDGSESVNSMRGTDVKSKAGWDGDKLKIASKLDFGGTEITLDQTWELSGDGNTLTNTLKINSPQGEFEIVYLLRKQ
jgi:hypothetical protein